MDGQTACNAKVMKTNDRQVQNELIFSLGGVQKQEGGGEKRKGVTDEGQRKGDGGGVAREERGGDR